MLDRAKRKGKDRSRTHIIRDFIERFRFLLQIGCIIEDSKLESARSDLIIRDHSGSDGERLTGKMLGWCQRGRLRWYSNQVRKESSGYVDSRKS